MKKMLLIPFLTLTLTACMPIFMKKIFPKKPIKPHTATAFINSRKLPDIYAPGINKGTFSRTNYLTASRSITKNIQDGDIQIVNEGHRITLIVPTDKYFLFDTAKLNDLKYEPLDNIVNLIKCFPKSTINIAGFTDDVGNYEYKRLLSNQRAQSIVSYLWSQGVSEKTLQAQGYGSRFAIANNDLIHGSALNRRVEIQWAI